MLYLLSLISYLLFFTFIAWHRFNLALALFFFLLPTYLIRFNIGPLPTTLLEMMLWIIVLTWIIKYRQFIIYHLSFIIKQNKLLFTGIALFLLGATISIFTSTNLRAALGEWKAFYVEPIIIFLILTTALNTQQQTGTRPISNFQFLISKRDPVALIIFVLTLSGLITSVLAIFQHFTGWMVPEAFWANQNTYRVTAWYGFPNAVGLFLAPIIPLAVYLLKKSLAVLKKIKYEIRDKIYLSAIVVNNGYLLSLISHLLSLLYIPTSILAIYFAKSTGALVGLAAGLLFFLFFYNKKSRWLSIIIAIVGLSSVLGLSGLSSIRQELFFQDRSGQIRLDIWSETYEFLKDSPVWGAGLASYQEKIRPYHRPVNGENIEIFHHPHNIFLTMYVNTGLLGLIGFVLILAWFFLSFIIYHLSRNREQAKQALFVVSSMVVLLTAGLVDSPYIKNDLSILFWLLPALLIIARRDEQFIPQ